MTYNYAVVVNGLIMGRTKFISKAQRIKSLYLQKGLSDGQIKIVPQTYVTGGR